MATILAMLAARLGAAKGLGWAALLLPYLPRLVAVLAMIVSAAVVYFAGGKVAFAFAALFAANEAVVGLALDGSLARLFPGAK